MLTLHSHPFSSFCQKALRPLARFPILAAYFQRLLDRPSFARAVDEARPWRHLFPGGAPEA